MSVGLLLLFYALALGTAVAKNPTVDEPVHFLRGLVLGQTGDLHLQFEHPPLSHRLIGSLLATEPSVPDVRQTPSWLTSERTQIAYEAVWQSGLNVERAFFLARIPVVWLGLLLGAMIASWALSWLGWRVMLVTLVLFSVSPNLLASSALATTDLAATIFYFATVYVWWRSFEYSGKRWWLLTAVFLGLALATKLTAVLLLPVMFLLALLYWRQTRSLWHILVAWLGLLPIALLIVWFVYGWEIAPIDFAPFPLPAATYFRSWQSVLGHVQEGHAAFFLGDLSTKGWWTYFPITFLIKTPLVTLGLILLGCFVILRNRQFWRTGLFLLVPVSAMVVTAMFSRLNIGYRHILPAVPFLLLIAGSAVLLLKRRWLGRVLLLLALAWTLLSGWTQYPHYLAYFNELVGGTEQGYRFLGDSNLDWGQDLNLLAETIKQEGGQWRVSYAGVADPGYYGLSDEFLIKNTEESYPFPAANPKSGTYALSANHIQGLLPDRDLLDWFRRREPDSTLGGSILIYEVQEQMSGDWAAHCLDPVPLLSTNETEQLLGQDGLRHLYFDCQQSWVLPDAGRTPGWFIMPQADQYWFLPQLSPENASAWQLVYRHGSSAFGPSYDVYYWHGGNGDDLVAQPMKQSTLSRGQTVSLPYALNDTMQLNGYQISGESWVTEWTVNGPAQEPLSLRAHLYTADEAPPLVADALGYSSEQWQSGDRLLQRFDFPEGGTAIFLETGIYNFQNLELLGDVLQLSGH